MTKVTEEKQKLTFAQIMALSIDEVKSFVKTAVKLAENIVTARDNERGERKQNAKYVADLRRRYAAGKDGGTIPSDWTFPKWAENIVGGKIPGRLQSLAALFNSLVLMTDKDGKPLLAEAVYDGCFLDWLEKANAIVNAAQKADGENWKSSKDVTDCIAALMGPPDKVVETLDAIRKRQKGETASDDSETGVQLTPEAAVEFLLKFFADQKALVAGKPQNLKEVFCTHLALGKRLDAVYTAQADMTEAFASVADDETLNLWTKQTESGLAPGVEFISSTPETAPVAATTLSPAPETAETVPAEKTEEPEAVEA